MDRRRNSKEFDVACVQFFYDDVAIDFDVFWAFMENGIGCQVHCRFVVAVDWSWLGEVYVQFFEEVMHPLNFIDKSCKSFAFYLWAEAIKFLLSLELPRDEWLDKDDEKPCDIPLSGEACGPITIWKSIKN